MIKIISTKELSGLLNSSKLVLVDIRPVDAYNGWKIQNETRGGHIKSAKS